VFDTYGRFIGDMIVIGKHGMDVDLNLWMARKGWAFPTFYASMSEEEIRKFRAAAAMAAKKKLGIWKGYRSKLSFDRALRYEDAERAPEAGAVSMPKIFRRLACDWVERGNTRLHAFLVGQRTPERCYKTDEFLEQGITVARQYELAGLVRDLSVGFGPGDLVFLEAGSMLVGERGERVVGW